MSPSASPAAAASVSCPVPDSGTCLGTLPAGTYATAEFQPTLTYKVPGGWSNFLDVSGLFLLMPPGAPPPGDTITTDFIGVQASVAAQASTAPGAPCDTSAAPGVARTPKAIADWASAQPGLRVTGRQTTTLGGLSGARFDVRPASGWTKGCLTQGLDSPVVPFIVGVDPSQFDHEIAKGYAERDYLLAYDGGTLLVDLVDATGGSHLDAYTRLVSSFVFGR